jgi:lipoic acid synthetase
MFLMNPYKPKVKVPDPEKMVHINNILNSSGLTTVCEEAACPNRNECYARDTATFMILGDTCTRACRFCNVKTGKGEPPDPTEPERLAMAVKALQLRYVVITSVDRDDLKDHGAAHFARCVKAIRDTSPEVKIELLTPDFRYDTRALDTVIRSKADKLAHNEETVRRLSAVIRPQSSYERSLQTLRYYAMHSKTPVKSSLMAGLGESEEELMETMQDLLDAGVTQLTLGQYLQPSPDHHPVVRYYPETFFEKMRVLALEMGFEAVASGILVRSSYFAENL